MGGGGLLQLVAYGQQDVYISARPQITYFKMMYRRHTNFSCETIEQPFDSAKFGGRTIMQVPRNGDLAKEMAIKLVFPEITGENLDRGTYVAWVRRVGHAVVKEVEVTVGGQRIDKITGVWLDIWYELTGTASHDRGYRELIGDVPEMTALRRRSDMGGDTEIVIPSRTVYVPLQFWFNKSSGLSLPLIALQYHEVKLSIEFEDVSKLIVWKGQKAPKLSNLSFKEAGVLIEYVFLDTDERRKFAQVGHEYLIEQLQFNGEESLTGAGGSLTNEQKYKLSFNHPTKELVLAVRLGAFNGEGNKSTFSGSRGRFLAYTHEDDWSAAVHYAACNVARGMVWFKKPRTRSGETLVSRTDYSTISATLEDAVLAGATIDAENGPLPIRVPLDGCRVMNVNLFNRTGRSNNCKRYADVANGSFAPCSYGATPCDTYCVVKGEDVPDIFILKKNVAVVRDGYDLANFIYESTVDIGLYRDASGAIRARVDNVHINGPNAAGVADHDINLTDVSIPIEDWKADNRSTSLEPSCNIEDGCHATSCDVVVTQPSNYGVRLDGSGNPLFAATIQFNGHERFKEQRGAYFNYLQTLRHHTRSPCDGINVYSFALEPEKHQPSGTANLSRIDQAYYNAKFRDPFRAGKNVPTLDLVKDTKVYLFAVNYNILRIMNGMGGTAYSN